MKLLPILAFAALVVPTIAVAAVRPATQAEITAIRASLQTQLKDADSAKFLNVRMNGSSVCGQVNCKNAFGAYVGFRTFFGMVFQPAKDNKLTKPTAMIMTIASDDSDTVADQMCAKEGF